MSISKQFVGSFQPTLGNIENYRHSSAYDPTYRPTPPYSFESAVEYFYKQITKSHSYYQIGHCAYGKSRHISRASYKSVENYLYADYRVKGREYIQKFRADFDNLSVVFASEQCD
jgi:hypothetical protein